MGNDYYTGKQIGNYHITDLLGRGGFGDVYLGRHIHLNTLAVIKVIHPWPEDKDTKNRLLHEAQITAHLVHSNIIQVLDFIIQNDISFLIMTYAPNGNLRQRHPRGSQLSPRTILPYVKQLASALQYIHDQGIIHRDVKPENMLLGRNNEVLLSDFGISVRDDSDLRTDTVGTLHYMAPEAIQGQPRKASDQYALGVTVYEWLSGSCPFTGSFNELFYQHISVPPPPLSTRLPTLERSIDNVVMTALAKQPDQRFSTVQAFAVAFEQACQMDLSGLPHIFVSHSSKDNQFGTRLVQELRRVIGRDNAVWYDASGGLQGGDMWWSKIKQELKARPVFIVILSPDALASQWVIDEINMAWRQKNSPLGKRIIPVLYRECDVPDDLDTLQVISFLNPKPYDIAMNELFMALGLPVYQGR